MATASRHEAATSPIKKGLFYVGLLLVVSLLDILINNLPTMFDIAILTLTALGSVVVGRMSRDWF
jgi:hypothetical protein